MAASDDGADWFTRRTFRAVDFDVHDLVRRKAASGTAVSVVLPARNERDTIAEVVAACLHHHTGLVDEVLVIDGDSDDDTAQLALDAGAMVHDRHMLLPQMGPALGKGDALWRALSVTKGDVVVYIDTDIRNPSQSLVPGLLAPLLSDAGIHLVKAFYDRPLTQGGVTDATGGGRVTELMARPLLNLFWPALSGLVQPLSGEYAARRGLLERVPFVAGYGVEFALLIDTLTVLGPDAIAQVDLSVRAHRNQSLDVLSRMAFEILQVAADRLQREGRLSESIAATYLQFTRTGDVMAPFSAAVNLVQRPPLATLKGGTESDVSTVEFGRHPVPGIPQDGQR